jgi:DNA-binding response OmpR family regulator
LCPFHLSSSITCTVATQAFAITFFFKPHSYSLVILDIKMPGLNGFALYREIKRLDKKVKVCFLTAGGMYYGYSDIFSLLPANCFIRKPIDNEELMKRINEIMIDDGFEAGDMMNLTTIG